MSAEHGRFTTIVVGEYRDPALDLPKIDSDSPEIVIHAARVAELLRHLGFVEDPRPGGSSAPEVQDWLINWRPDVRRILLYWTGHAQDDGDDLLLFCSDYHEQDNPLGRFSGRELGKLLARGHAVEIVVILDVCKGGVGAEVITNAFRTRIARQEFPVGREPGLAVLTSARAGELARDGAFAAALDHVLRVGPPPPTDTIDFWTAHDQLITPTKLYKAVLVHLADSGARQRPDLVQSRAVDDFFPFFINGNYRANRPDATVDTVRDRAFTESDLLEHFLVKFRGIDTPTADGWYYAPRPHSQARITDWLATGEGILVITGPPGSGKSALLGWLAAMTMPGYRDRAAAKTGDTEHAGLPAVGAIDAGIHAKQHTLQECVTQLGEALNLTAPEAGWQEPGPLIEQISQLTEREDRTVTILLDALDEAYPADQPRIATDLLAALAAQPRVRVIVGTRPNREDPHQRTDHTTTPEGPWTAEGPLIRALATDPDQILRLDTDPGSVHAITTYVTTRLTDPTTNSPYRDQPALAADTAAVVAAHSDGIFLFARLIARSLINREAPLDLTDPHNIARFNGGVAQAFEDDLAGYGADRDRVYGLLAPLAWAEGAGLPRRDIWLALANALARPGVVYTDRDISWVLAHAGAHIVESGEDGQTVYRLYHQAFNDYFQRNIDHITVQTAITHALLDLTDPA